jgi:dienelactone hydrolase
MRNLCFLVAIVASCTLAVLAWAADGPSKQLAVRTELHQVQTLTLSDQQFLKGEGLGTPVTITGQLRIAQGSGRLPLVVLQHGSSGLGANVEVWSRELNELGIATFALDGFTGRGLTEVGSNQASLSRLNFILDIYRALGVLANHPRIDPARIALMGFSRGGQAALYASLQRFHKLWNKSGLEFVAYVPFYPDCMTTFLTDTDVLNRPIRIFGGTSDDYNPISACKAYVTRLQAAGRDVELTEYPNAAHVFDNPLAARPPAVAPTFQTVRNCKIQEEAEGRLINVETNQPFTYTDACVERGPHLGYDPAATQAAKVAVGTLLKKMFKLD